MNSPQLFERAKRVIPGGVNSPVRAFRGVGGDPLFIREGHGAFVVDAEGREYVDYVGSWGPAILGHADPEVVEEVCKAAKKGMSFGAPTELEVALAEEVVGIVPGIQMLRMVSSGTEATMSAIRLARGFTGRDYVVKCDGCYHGHADSLLVQAGSGVATLGIPGSAGVPAQIAGCTLSVEFNDLELMEQALKKVGPEKVAAVIIEPVPGNMGLVLPKEGYLKGLRELCSQHGILLIFDEVMTGFRVGLGGAQERFQVLPDLTTLGKVLGGGLPVGAFGGRKDIMEQVAPLGPVYQAGTLSGNPLAMAAGLATIRKLKASNPYPALEEFSRMWAEGIQDAGKATGIEVVTSSCGSMVGLFFSKDPVRNYSEAKRTDVERFKKFFHAMLQEGVYFAPSAFEAGFLSVCHTREIIERTIVACRKVFAGL